MPQSVIDFMNKLDEKHLKKIRRDPVFEFDGRAIDHEEVDDAAENLPPDGPTHLAIDRGDAHIDAQHPDEEVRVIGADQVAARVVGIIPRQRVQVDIAEPLEAARDHGGDDPGLDMEPAPPHALHEPELRADDEEAVAVERLQANRANHPRRYGLRQTRSRAGILVDEKFVR